MSEDLRLIVDIVSKKDYNKAKKDGDAISYDVYTKKAKSTSAWEALKNLKYDDGKAVFNEAEITKIYYGKDPKKINRRRKPKPVVPEPQINGEFDLTEYIKKAGFGDRLQKLAQQDQGKNNPFNTNNMSADGIPNPFSIQNVEEKLTYNNDKLNDLFVASYKMIEDDTTMTVEINNQKITSSKQNILAQLAQDGEITADEQAAFIKGAVNSAKATYREDGKNKKLKKGETNSQEDIDILKHMSTKDYSKYDSDYFSEKYLEANNKNTRDKRDAKVSARRILTELDVKKELGKIVDASEKKSISINLQTEPVELSQEQLLPYKKALSNFVLDLPEGTNFDKLVGVKNGNTVTISDPSAKWSAEVVLEKGNLSSFTLTKDKEMPNDFVSYTYEPNSGILLESTKSESEGNCRNVTSKVLSDRVCIMETYSGDKLIRSSKLPLNDNNEVPADAVSLDTSYVYLPDGTTIEEKDESESLSVINKYDAKGNLISSEAYEWIDGDDKTYNISVNGKAVNVSTALTEKSANDFMSKIPASVLSKVPFAQSGDLAIAMGTHCDNMYGVLVVKDNTGWFIQANKDGNFEIGVYDKAGKNVEYCYTLDSQGTVIKKEPQDAPDLETIYPQTVAPVEKPKTEKTENAVSTETVKDPVAQTPKVDVVAQFKYNDNPLNNLFISSFKMIDDDTQLEYTVDGKKVKGTKQEYLDYLAKDGKITTEDQTEFIWAARTSAVASFGSDKKAMYLKKGEKNTQEDLEVFKNLPFKDFYNLKSSFYKENIASNKRDARISARRVLARLEITELEKIAKKSGDTTITIVTPEAVVKPQETTDAQTSAVQPTIVAKQEEKTTQVATDAPVTQIPVDKPVAQPAEQQVEQSVENPNANTPVLVGPPPEELTPDFSDFDEAQLNVAPVITNGAEMTIAAPFSPEDKDKDKEPPVVVALDVDKLGAKSADVPKADNTEPPVTDAAVEEQSQVEQPKEPTQVVDTQSTTTAQPAVQEPIAPAAAESKAEEPAEVKSEPVTQPAAVESSVVDEKVAQPVAEVEVEKPAVEQKPAPAGAVLTDMPDATRDMGAFIEYMGEKNPELAKELKTCENATSTRTADGYEISYNKKSWGEDVPVKVKVYADGTAELFENDSIKSSYDVDGTYVQYYDNKTGTKYSANGEVLLNITYRDDACKLKETETVYSNTGNQITHYGQDGKTVDYKLVYNPVGNQYTKTSYKDGNVTAEEIYKVNFVQNDAGEWVSDDKLLSSSVCNPDGSKVKIVNGKIIEKTTIVDGAQTTVTWKQKTEELGNVIESGDFEQATKLVSELLADNWNLAELRANRDTYNLKDVNAQAVNDAWSKINEGLQKSDLVIVQEGVSALKELQSQGAPIQRASMTEDDIKNHYKPFADKAYGELMTLLASGNVQNLAEVDSVKKLKELREKFGLTFDYTVDTNLPKVAEAWNTILSGNVKDFDAAISTLNEVKSLNLNMNPNLDKKAKDDVTLSVMVSQEDFVGSLDSATSVEDIMNSDLYKKLVAIGLATGAVDIKLRNNNTPALMHNGRVLFDTTKLQEIYTALSKAINSGDKIEIKKQLEALEEAKANGFPISIEGSAQYDVKYVPQYSIDSEKLKDVRAKHTTKSSWIMRTSLDVFKEDVVEPFNKSKKGLAGVKEANGGGTPGLHLLSSGLDGSPVNSNEFAVAIYCINSKAQLDQLNQILKECATRQAGDNPDNLIASWCLRSGRPDLLRHLGQYDPYFQDLYNKTKKQNTAK